MRPSGALFLLWSYTGISCRPIFNSPLRGRRTDSVARFVLRISILCLFLVVQSLAARENSPQTELELPQLSSAAVISLITYSPGTELYTAFGHSCIRIEDDVLGFDRLYNFGTFDFETPHFYWKFARGDLLYDLAVGPSMAEINDRGQLRQGVTALVLNLNPEQKQALFQALEINLLPQNRAYLYDFILDNCSTRVRDVFERIIGKPIEAPLRPNITFRQMLDPYLDRLPWTQFGLNLLLGSPTDRAVTGREACFLPADLERAVSAVRLADGPLSAERAVIVRPDNLPDPAIALRPFFVFAAVGVAWVLYWIIHRKGHHPGLTGLVLLLAGAAGIFISWFMCFSRHWVTHSNLNLLWLWPTHALAGLWLILQPETTARVLRVYLTLSFLLTALFLLAAPFLPQGFPPAMYPLLAILLWRCGLEWGAQHFRKRSL
jgi:Domain of unknown function (DUF4105)